MHSVWECMCVCLCVCVCLCAYTFCPFLPWCFVNSYVGQCCPGAGSGTPPTPPTPTFTYTHTHRHTHTYGHTHGHCCFEHDHNHGQNAIDILPWNFLYIGCYLPSFLNLLPDPTVNNHQPQFLQVSSALWARTLLEKRKEASNEEGHL